MQNTSNNGSKITGKADDFVNLEKSSNFEHKITKDEINNIVSGISEVSYGANIQAAANYLRKGKGTGSSIGHSDSRKDREESLLRKHIGENNLWYSADLKSPFDCGFEQKVYLFDKKYVIKTNNRVAFDSWEDYLNNLLLQNYFFPANAYELLGFKDENGKLLSVVKQLYVEETEGTNMELLKYFLLENGFESIRNNNYENFDLGITLNDLHDKNVLTENGVLQFIDTVFKIKHENYSKETNNMEETLEKEKQELQIVSADFKFTDFSEHIPEIPSIYHKESWYFKLREIDAKIYMENMQDKIAFNDDRLIIIAYKVMTETDLFSERAKIREWWIVQRYIQLYARQYANIDKIVEMITMYMGFSFSGAAMDEITSEKFKALTKEIGSFVYEDGYLKLPEFVLEVINAESFEPIEDEVEEYDFNDHQVRFEGLLETAEMMLRQELPEEEKELWKAAYHTAIEMLESLK